MGRPAPARQGIQEARGEATPHSRHPQDTSRQSPFQVIRRSRGTERYSRNVLFLMLLQVLGQFRSLTYAYQQHTCRQRVQSAGVTDFQILLTEMPACTPFDLTDDISRCPAVRLVYRKNNPSG